MAINGGQEVKRKVKVLAPLSSFSCGITRQVLRLQMADCKCGVAALEPEAGTGTYLFCIQQRRGAEHGNSPACLCSVSMFSHTRE